MCIWESYTGVYLSEAYYHCWQDEYGDIRIPRGSSGKEEEVYFTCFMDLPTEIRLQIWKHALPDPKDIFLIFSENGPFPFTVFGKLTDPPNVHHICMESRTFFLEHYQVVPSYDKPHRRAPKDYIRRKYSRTKHLAQEGVAYCDPTRDLYRFDLVSWYDKLDLSRLDFLLKTSPHFLSSITYFQLNIWERYAQMRFDHPLKSNLWYSLKSLLRKMKGLNQLRFELLHDLGSFKLRQESVDASLIVDGLLLIASELRRERKDNREMTTPGVFVNISRRDFRQKESWDEYEWMEVTEEARTRTKELIEKSFGR